VTAGRLTVLVAVALAVVVALGAASTASASAPAASLQRHGGLCHLFPWLPWCHDHDDCDDPGHHHGHHPHHCDDNGGGDGGGGDPGDPGGAGGGDDDDGGGAPGGGGPGGPGGAGGPGTGDPGAGAPGGSPGQAGTIAVDTRAPSFVAKPRLHPTRFRAARGRGASIAVRTGTTIVYRLNEPARVTFTVQKHRALSRACRRKLAVNRHRTGTRCKRWISLKGRFAKASAAGANSVRFTGRLKRRPLPPGSYRLVVRARDAAGNVTRPKRPRFRIVR
jgi:hypothetical protein